MKTLALILLLLPFTAIARKKTYADPCDSMSKVIVVMPSLTSVQVANNIESGLKSYPIGANNLFSFNKINDSTIVCSGTFLMDKAPGNWLNNSYGHYTIPSNSDGKISFMLTFKTKEGKYKYEITNTNHFGCKYIYGDLCNSKYNDNTLKGLQIKFLEKMDQILILAEKANEANEW